MLTLLTFQIYPQIADKFVEGLKNITKILQVAANLLKENNSLPAISIRESVG